MELSAKTPLYATEHAPLGRPGGPGLFGVQGMQLPAYIQHIAHALIRDKGYRRSRAIATAIAAVKRWASGRGAVSPEVRAAAAKAVAEWEANKARAHTNPSIHRGLSTTDALSTVDLSRHWDPVKHPRIPGGHHGGGRFVTAADTVGTMDTEAYVRHTQHVAQALDAAKRAGLDTRDLHQDQYGQWTPHRRQQHTQVADELWAGAAHGATAKTEGKVVMAGGLSGAGKSTVLERHLGIDKADYVEINPDIVKEHMAARGMIPSVPGLSPMEASSLAHEEAGHVADMLIDRARHEGKNLLYDITMSGSSRRWVEDELAAARRRGYHDARGVFVDIPIATSVARTLQRHRDGHEAYQAGHGHGGRWVPSGVIKRNASTQWPSANRGVFEQVKHRFDGWQLWDNAGRQPQRLAQRTQP